MKSRECEEDVAIFCEKIARQLRFVDVGLDDGGHDAVKGGAADILGVLATQCEEFAEGFMDSEKKCEAYAKKLTELKSNATLLPAAKCS
jgi:hypothetical protein